MVDSGKTENCMFVLVSAVLSEYHQIKAFSVLTNILLVLVKKLHYLNYDILVLDSVE